MNDSMKALRGRGMTREYWRARVLFALQFTRDRRRDEWVESSAIARLVGREKTSHFMGILNELRDEGFIHMDFRPYRPNQSAHVWMIDSSVAFTERWKQTFTNLYGEFLAEQGVVQHD